MKNFAELVKRLEGESRVPIKQWNRRLDSKTKGTIQNGGTASGRLYACMFLRDPDGHPIEIGEASS